MNASGGRQKGTLTVRKRSERRVNRKASTQKRHSKENGTAAAGHDGPAILRHTDVHMRTVPKPIKAARPIIAMITTALDTAGRTLSPMPLNPLISQLFPVLTNNY